jgi:dTDP-4-dehydrorhamnose reductase
MKSLIIGSNGLIGTALSKLLPDALQGVQFEAKAKNQRYIDISKYETLFKVFTEFRPQVVYLAAAITDVNKCEDYGTSIINIRGSTQVLRLCEMFESKLVFYSSSYVFDGKKESPYTTEDEPLPLQQYGKQKLTMENLISSSELEYLIIRTVGVFGVERKKKNFAKQVISSVFAGKEVFAPTDQFMNPISSEDLAEISIQLAKKTTGLFHVAGDTCISKYEFARRIAGYFRKEDKVIPVTTEEMNQRALRPKMGCLDCFDLLACDIEIPSLDSGIQKFLAKDWNG